MKVFVHHNRREARRNRPAFAWSGLLCLMLLFALTSVAGATDWEDFVGESMWTVSHTTQVLLDDPTLSAIVYRDLWETFNTRRWGFSDIGTQTGLELTTSPTQTALIAPVSFRYYKLHCSAILPMLLHRTFDYRYRDASRIGLGDLSFMAGYPIRLWDVDVYGNLGVKLPTGSYTISDGPYLTPMSTGTWDFYGGLEARVRIKRDQWIYLDTQYRKTGTQSYRVLRNDYRTDLDVSNSDLLYLTTAYIRTFGVHTSAFLAGTFYVAFEGETDFHINGPNNREIRGSWTNDQRLFSLELTPGINYDIWLVTVRAMATLPIHIFKEDSNYDDRRSWSMRLGVAYFL